MEKIIGIGNALTDILAVLKDDTLLESMELPKGSTHFIEKEKLSDIHSIFSSMDTKRVPGGSAANTVRALANMGSHTGFIGKVGHDETGDFYLNSFHSLGIETLFNYSELPSGIASTFISPDGERTFIDYLGAASTLNCKDISEEILSGYSYLYVEGYLVQNHEMITHALQLAKKNGLTVCLDLSSYNIVADDQDFFTDLIKNYVDIVFANEEEAKAFTDKDGREALDDIASKCSIAVLKVGAKGSYIKKGSEVVYVEALANVKTADTTAAGDYYAAGFLFGLTHGYNLAKCGAIGSLLAGNIIEVIGSTLSDARWDAIKEQIKELS